MLTLLLFRMFFMIVSAETKLELALNSTEIELIRFFTRSAFEPSTLISIWNSTVFLSQVVILIFPYLLLILNSALGFTVKDLSMTLVSIASGLVAKTN